MADAAISFAVEKLGDALINKVNFLRGVDEQVRWLRDELQSMRCFLKDAVEKQGNDERIRQWIRDVREVAQDAEDAIEIFTLKVNNTSTRKRDLVRKWACFPAHVSHLNKVGEEIESIKTRLKDIRERRETYGIGNLGEVGITESSLGSRSEVTEMRRRILNDKDVVGLDQVTNLLLKEAILNDELKGLSLAAIVGMGGSGKSTLARKIYNHPAVAARFEYRAWVVVSSEFAAEDIMKQIMHELSVPLDTNELKTLESIQEKLRRQGMLQDLLRKRLQGKRYFIVLDDVWEAEHWELALKNAFPDEQDKGSRLLFTSRNQIITVNSGYVHNMNPLSSEESWQLLLKTAFEGRSEERCPRELEDVGREISEKCHGLPLAITVAGGLPSELKPCFLCLAFFKEDKVIKAKQLVHIWAALGLVQAGEESVEDIGRRHLDRLIKRNLILVERLNAYDGVKYCYVHDLLRDLSIRKAKEEIGFERLSSEGSSSSQYKPRHRVVQIFRERLVQVDTLNLNKHLRTLFLHVENPYGDADILDRSYWKGLELLRILDIESNQLERFPPKIRALVGIKYLRIRAEYSTLELPSWLDVLKNLEVLDVAECEAVWFPDVTWKMDSLRHLYISKFHLFPNSMKKSSWKNLKTLKDIGSNALVSGNNPIQGFSDRLHKLGIIIVGEGLVAEVRRLINESAVQVLHLRWFQRMPFPILNSLDSLTKLKLEGHRDGYSWSANYFPQNITHLTLVNSDIRYHDAMQELGKLPKLLVLKLYRGISGTVLKVPHAGFPRLKVLRLTYMASLENIEIEEGGMPELRRLEIYQCPKLQNIQNLRECIRPAEFIIHYYTFDFKQLHLSSGFNDPRLRCFLKQEFIKIK